MLKVVSTVDVATLTDVDAKALLREVEKRLGLRPRKAILHRQVTLVRAGAVDLMNVVAEDDDGSLRGRVPEWGNEMHRFTGEMVVEGALSEAQRQKVGQLCKDARAMRQEWSIQEAKAVDVARCAFKAEHPEPPYHASAEAIAALLESEGVVVVRPAAAEPQLAS